MLDIAVAAGEEPKTFAEGKRSCEKDLPHKLLFTASLKSVSIFSTITFNIENVRVCHTVMFKR